MTLQELRALTAQLRAGVIIGTLVAASSAAFAQNAAVVNGKPVPKARVDAVITSLVAQGQPRTPEMEKMVREEMINREIMMQEAERRGISNNEEVRTQLEMGRQAVIIRALFADFQKKSPISPSEVQAEYDKFKAQSADKEYRARHILVEKEDEAAAIVAQIKGGQKFEDIAKKASKDPGSGANGGDLDWAPAAAYVPEFSAAMAALNKGQMTDKAVKSQFGFHIIRLDDVRATKVPTLEEVKPQIEQQLGQRKLQEFQKSLRDKAKIQ
jgi:peptidyl-prolyl cis-trans isomerase C